MRLLIHYYGDYHQPFHMINQFSSKHPNGDNGGKDFNLNSQYKNLHDLWDH